VGVCIESGQANRGMRPGGTGRGEREQGGGGVGGATTVGEIRGSSGGTPGAVEASGRDLWARSRRSRFAQGSRSRVAQLWMRADAAGGAGHGWGARQNVHQTKCGRLHYLLK
jgi:hypothetical protein